MCRVREQIYFSGLEIHRRVVVYLARHSAWHKQLFTISPYKQMDFSPLPFTLPGERDENHSVVNRERAYLHRATMNWSRNLAIS